MQALILAKIAEMERVLARLATPAVVHERDHKKGVRFKLAEDAGGNPELSSWTQPPDQNKGTRSRWLPEVGSQHLLLTVPGTDYVASFVPMSHHENSENPATSAGDTVIYDDGTCRIGVKGGAISLKSGGSSITIADGKIELSSELVKAIGDALKHNDKSVGDDHKHQDVLPGGGVSGVPL